MSEAPRIENESEDLFAEEREHSDHEDDSELSAAAALTSLVSMRPFTAVLREADGKDDDQGEEEVSDKELNIPQRYTKSGRKRAVSFPLKLLKVLSMKKFEEVIAWTPSGKAFEIRKPKQFVAEVLPTFFKNAKYSSFTRKLHRWGFMRHYRGEEAGAFYHAEFLKNRLDLVEQMTCHKDVTEPVKKIILTSAKKQAVKAAEVPTSTAPAAQRPMPTPAPMRPLVTINATAINAPQPAAPRPSAPPVDRNMGLNAAIELEVARRLEERINAAALSRQALAIMEHQRHQQQLQAKLNSLLEQRYVALAQQQQRGLALAQPLDLTQVYRKYKSAPAPNLSFGSGAFSALPPTNIQGAKTA